MNRPVWTYAAIGWATFAWSCASVIGIEDGHPRASAGGAAGLAGAAGMPPKAGAGGVSGSGLAGAPGVAGSGGADGGIAGQQAGGGAGQQAGGGTGQQAGSGGADQQASGGATAGQAGASGSGGDGASGGGDGGSGGGSGIGSGYGLPPAGVDLRLLSSTSDDPVAGLATDGASSLIVTGRLGGPMPIGAAEDLSPVATGQTSYVLRYTEVDALAFAARLHAPKLLTRRVIAGPDGSIYVLGEADGALAVLDAPAIDPGSSPTEASRGPFVVRFDALGRLAWVFRPNAAPGQRLELPSIALAASGTAVLVAGSFDGTIQAGTLSATSTNGTSVDVVVVGLAAETGAVEQLRAIGTAGPDENARIVEGSEGSRLAFTCSGAFATPPASGLPDCQGIVTIALDDALGIGAGNTFGVSGPDQLVLARGRPNGFLVGARYAGTAALPPLPPLPAGPGRFLVAMLDDAGSPVRARTLPEPSVLSLEVIAADLDGGVLVGGNGRGCLAGDSGGQVCSSPANAKNGLVVRFDPTLGLQWAAFQTASTGAPQGIVKGLVLCPNGELLGASSFDTSVTVLKQKVPWKGGTDTVVGRFFH